MTAKVEDVMDVDAWMARAEPAYERRRTRSFFEQGVQGSRPGQSSAGGQASPQSASRAAR